MVNVSEQIRLGEHAALFYAGPSEQFESAIPYMRAGLLRNERCLYIVNDNSVEVILQQLESAGVDVNEAVASGALRVVTKKESYLRHGTFEPTVMIADLKREIQGALRKGFAGFRVTGETTWALDLPSMLAKLLEYEERLHKRFATHMTALCQYDETRFRPETISQVMALHHVVIRRGELIRNPGGGSMTEPGGFRPMA